MRPIRDIAEIQPSSVLYHSAFGFARVESLAEGKVELDWEQAGDNLPTEVSIDNIRKVYALCPRGGFFDQALNAPEALAELLQVDPPTALVLLLEDLSGPQRIQDLREWVVGRTLMSHEAFDRWWETLQPMLAEDERFQFDAETMSLQAVEERISPIERLANPLLSAARRLDIALAHRQDLDDEVFRSHALMAWRYGGTQVRDLALAALRDTPPDLVLQGLVATGPESVEALIHAIRRAGWAPADITESTHHRLRDRVIDACRAGGPLDSEGRLAATLARWGSPGFTSALGRVAGQVDGQRLLRATLDALPPRRSERLALDMLDLEVERGPDSPAAQWLADEILARAASSDVEMADQVAPTHPRLADWFRDEYQPPSVGDLPEIDDFTEDDGYPTLELDPEPIITTLPVRPSEQFIALGLALARCLAGHHSEDRVVNPTRDTVAFLPDGTPEIEPAGNAAISPRPLTEAPTTMGDTYATAVLLLEMFLGRPWPRNVPANRVTPYLRHLLPDLPPTALAPLDNALHPVPRARPANGLSWLVQWQAAAIAEDDRAIAGHDPRAKLRIGYDTHVGRMKVLHTQTNQDALFVSTKGPLSLLVVCDGISTANAGSGDIAASITAQVIASLWDQALARLARADDLETRDFLDRSLRMANQAVCEAAMRFAGGRLEGRVPMGTTTMVAIANGNRINLASLGDSRTYLLGAHGASLLGADQNQAGERLRDWHAGLSPSWDPNGYALVGYVGHFNEWGRPELLAPAHSCFTLIAGERLVLCTDGVTDYIGHTHPEVCADLLDGIMDRDVDEAAREMVNRANRGGGGDNATIVVATLATS